MSEFDHLKDLINAESQARIGEDARLSSGQEYLRDRFNHYSEIQDEQKTATRRYLLTTFIATGSVLIGAMAFIVVLIGKFH